MSNGANLTRWLHFLVELTLEYLINFLFVVIDNNNFFMMTARKLAMSFSLVDLHFFHNEQLCIPIVEAGKVLVRS